MWLNKILLASAVQNITMWCSLCDVSCIQHVKWLNCPYYTLCGTVALLMQVTQIAMTLRQSHRLSNPSARYFKYKVKELRIHQSPFRGQAQRMLVRYCHGNGNDFMGMGVIGHSKNHWRTALTWNCMSAGCNCRTVQCGWSCRDMHGSRFCLMQSSTTCCQKTPV